MTHCWKTNSLCALFPRLSFCQWSSLKCSWLLSNPNFAFWCSRHPFIPKSSLHCIFQYSFNNRSLLLLMGLHSMCFLELLLPTWPLFGSDRTLKIRPDGSHWFHEVRVEMLQLISKTDIYCCITVSKLILFVLLTIMCLYKAVCRMHMNHLKQTRESLPISKLKTKSQRSVGFYWKQSPLKQHEIDPQL